MSTTPERMIQIKASLRNWLNSLRIDHPSITPAEVMIGLVAEAGYGMHDLPEPAKGKMFQALLSVLAQEAGIGLVAQQVDGVPPIPGTTH